MWFPAVVSFGYYGGDGNPFYTKAFVLFFLVGAIHESPTFDSIPQNSFNPVPV